MIQLLLSELWPYIVAALGVIGLFGAGYGIGKSNKEAETQRKRLESEVKANETATKVYEIDDERDLRDLAGSLHDKSR